MRRVPLESDSQEIDSSEPMSIVAACPKGAANSGEYKLQVLDLEAVDASSTVRRDGRTAKVKLDIGHTQRFSRIAWLEIAQQGSDCIIAAVQNNTFDIYKISDDISGGHEHVMSSTASQHLNTLSPDPVTYCTFSFSPHHPFETIAGGSHFEIWDIRKKTCAQRVVNFNGVGIQSVTHNPNDPSEAMSGNEDGSICIWDTRKLTWPVERFSGMHADRVQQAVYNSYHDNLLLSSGGDGAVRLWSLPCTHTNLSTPLPTDDKELSPRSAAEQSRKRTVETALTNPLQGLLNEREGPRLIDEHVIHQTPECAVPSLCWSETDAWTFGSASFDGSVVIRQVSSHEKYRILL
eukprot:Lankesteria_metandrocarpae@DN4881_c0_g1_i2.p2